MTNMRVWVVTALDIDGNFIDQRRIEAPSREVVEDYALMWIRKVGGNWLKSKIDEVI